MFFRAPMMLTLMRNGGDNAGLIVVPAMRGDSGLFTKRRARTIRGHKKLGIDGGPVIESNVRAAPRAAAPHAIVTGRSAGAHQRQYPRSRAERGAVRTRIQRCQLWNGAARRSDLA